jgi:hypothetical protein
MSGAHIALVLRNFSTEVYQFYTIEKRGRHSPPFVIFDKILVNADRSGRLRLPCRVNRRERE